MNVAEQDVPRMLQYARWYIIGTREHLLKLPICDCPRWKKQMGENAGPCGRCHTLAQLAKAEQFVATYGGEQ